MAVARLSALLLIGLLTMADLKNDDFESGDALATGWAGIIDAETANGIGVGGGWGVRTIGTDSQKYFGEFRNVTFGSSLGRGGTAEASFDHAHVALRTDTYYAIDVRRNGGGSFLSLYHDVGTNGLQVHWQNDVDFPNPESAVFGSAYTPGTFTKIKLSWCLSTITEAFDSNADGRIQVYVNDVLLIDLPNINLTPAVSFNYWDQVAFGPMGNLDNAIITDEGCADLAPAGTIPLNESTPCCGDTVNPATGGTSVGGAQPVNPYRVILPFLAACDGGGTVPSAADLTDAEDWSV